MKVEIEVKGGMVYDVKFDSPLTEGNVRLNVRDYDIEGMDADRLVEDDKGELCCLSIYGNPNAEKVINARVKGGVVEVLGNHQMVEVIDFDSLDDDEELDPIEVDDMNEQLRKFRPPE